MKPHPPKIGKRHPLKRLNLSALLNTAPPGGPGVEGALDYSAQFAAGRVLACAGITDFDNDGTGRLMAFWCYATAKPGNNMGLMSKFTNGLAWDFYTMIDQASDRFMFGIADVTGTNSDTVSANTFGSPPLNTRLFVAVYYDNVNSRIGISINGGAWDTKVIAFTPTASSAIFRIGTRFFSLDEFSGSIDSAVFGKAPPSGVAAVADTFRNSLYNTGRGVLVNAISPAQIASWGLIAGWDFREGTGLTRVPSIGASPKFDLSDNNSNVVQAATLIT